jgi:hypothetical protein
MILKYSLACLVIVGILAFLKFCEGSPIRSWKAVFFTAIPLGFITCYYISCAFPPPPPPATHAEKSSAYRAELERTFRRIAGVDRATFDGSIVQMNFAEDKPLSELKSIARQTGGTAAHFLKAGEGKRVTVHITVRGRKRYEMEYEANRGVVFEESY